MLNQATKLPLKDPTLFRQANCIDGKWIEADSGKTIAVKNPATGETWARSPPSAPPKPAARSRPRIAR